MEVGLLSREANYYPAARARALRSPEVGAALRRTARCYVRFHRPAGGAQRLMGWASSQISTRVCRAAAAQSDCTFFGGQGLLLMGRERFPNVDEVQIANQRSIRGEAELELFGRVVLV